MSELDKNKNKNKINNKIYDQEDYKELVDRVSPDSNIILNCFNAFWTGGLICVIGQVLNNFFMFRLNFDLDNARTLTAISLIFLGVLLTDLNIYDKFGKYAGAGTLVPITGFANAIAAPALEFKKEGYIFGVGAKIFVIAGPVILYSLFSSFVFGIIYYFFR
jgi:stage V sporulation protein AC